MKRVLCFALYIILMAAIMLQPGCSKEPVRLHILEAGSLVIPFGELEAEFERQHPDIDVLLEGHGSIQVIRHITEIHDEIDVAAVADHSLLPSLMYPVELPDGEGTYADWKICFATNRLGIAYTAESAHADEINQQNWHEVLAMSDVTYGFSDPRFDACGYRTLMVMQLAEDHYQNQDVFERLAGYSFQPPIRANEENGVYTISVPEVFEPVNNNVRLRGFSVQLLALLESRDLDYAFLYESVARQHGLEFLDLPAEINLSSEEYRDNYERVWVKGKFRRFASVTPEFQGQPIIYGITIPNNAIHREEAIEFLEFLLSPAGMQILSSSDQPVMPPVVDNMGNVPTELQSLVDTE
jgi:molybdate/tungstate transport system substrate-binding protein